MKAYGEVVVQYNQSSVSTLDGEWPASPAGRFTPIATESEVGWNPEPIRTLWSREKFRPCREYNYDSSVSQSVRSRTLNILFFA
jgi:hypothetical protein